MYGYELLHSYVLSNKITQSTLRNFLLNLTCLDKYLINSVDIKKLYKYLIENKHTLNPEK